VDLVIERSRQIPYAVVEFGDVIGLGGSWYYIPMAALSIDRANRLAILALSPKELTRLKGYPKGSLPDTTSSDWDRDIWASWERFAAKASGGGEAQLSAQEQARRAARREQPGAILASTLLSYRVVNPEGDALGEVTELMIDLEAARLAYPIISFGGFLGLGSKEFPVPPDRLRVDSSRGVLVLNVEPELFREAPGYGRGQWPDTADRFWRTTVDRYWTGGS
jgi:sporulation protein YlmC with PRC-barrel domain